MKVHFKYLEYWYSKIIDTADNDIIINLIGNKKELIYESGRVVNKKLAINFVKEHSLQRYAGFSAENNVNIMELLSYFIILYM